jgi:hypothetical protein
MSKTVWNPLYLRACVETAVRLMNDSGAKGAAFDLLERAAQHLGCCNTGDCRAYRAELKTQVARLRRQRRLTPWEYWLLEAAKSLLNPIPGTKHQAVGFLRSSIAEFDAPLGQVNAGLHNAWMAWHEQHLCTVPPYLEGRQV